MPLISAIDLRSIPSPAVMEEPEFQTIFNAILDQFQAVAPEYAYFLASDPVVKVLQAIAYREMVWRELTNNCLRQTFLAFATGTNLDNLGALHNVERMLVTEADETANPPVAAVYEGDDSFRARIQARVMGYSSAGPADAYRYYALTSDPRVRDVAVYSPDLPNGINMGGRVNITVMSNEETRIPSLNLLSVVRDVVNRDDVRAINDIVTVETPVVKDVGVRADIILDSNAPYDVFAGLGTVLETAFNRAQTLGWDVTVSWLHKTLMVDGVYDVILYAPDKTINVRFNEFARLVNVDIRFAGFVPTHEYDVNEQERRRIFQLVYEYYIAYAITNKRTAQQIMGDLSKQPVEGVIQPTTLGLARYIGITPLTDPATNEVLAEEEIAELIHEELSKYYDGSYTRARRL